MSAASDVNQTFQRLLDQYQRHVVTRTGLVGLLGLGCLAALLWRLHELGWPPSWLLGAGLGGLLALGLWQWQAITRDWLFSADATLKLDRALRLKERLVTAAEFAHVLNPPLLYPVLVQDTALALSSSRKHLPRIADRWTFILAGVLLLLALWPLHKALPQQLAMLAPSPLPPVEPPVPPSSDLPATMSKEQAGQSQQQASQDQPTKGSGASQERPEKGPIGASSGRSEQDGVSGPQGAQDTSQQSLADPGQPSPSQAPQNAPAGGQTQTDHAKSLQPSDTSQSESQEAGRALQQQALESKVRPSDKAPGRAGQDSLGGSSAQKQTSAQDRGSAGGDQTQQQLSQTAQGAGAGQMSSAQGDLLKAQIQQLLKELSGELKQLQTQLTAQQKDTPSPLPGTTTDPELYEANATLEQATGSHLPIQFDVDTQPTAVKRPGGGVGEPSGEVAKDAPQQEPESAQLADKAAEESPVHRKPIPPEYKSVFERLYQKSEQP